MSRIETQLLTVKARSTLSLAALLAFAAALSLFTFNTTNAQAPTATAPALSTPELTAEATARGVVLSWEAVPNAVRYELWTWWDAGIGWQQIGGNSLTGTSYTHAGVTAGTQYYYSIRAWNAAGESSAWLTDYPTATALATQRGETSTPTPTTTQTGAGTLTSTPTPTATASALATPELTAEATARGVVLSWEAVPNAVRYELWTWWDAGIGWQQIGGNSLTGTSYTHAGVTAGTQYYYSIRAWNAAGESSAWLTDHPTATALATPVPETRPSTPPPPPTPTAPGLPAPTLKATLKGAYATELSWTPVPGAVRYELGMWWLGKYGWLRQSGASELQTLSMILGGLAAGKTHYFAIAGVDSSGARGLFSEPVPVTIRAVGTAGSDERAALVAFYQATDGGNWEHNDNWLTGAPVATWFGVFTDHNGHVKRLNLKSNGLRGSIPDLSALKNLWGLNLAENQLSGPVPDLDDLTNLTKLELSYNRLSGPFPDLSALSNLRVVDFESNQLSGTIPDLSPLTKLQQLYLADNQLSGPFPDLSALNNLDALALGGNKLSGPILNLNHLTNLTYLILRNNQLSGPIPDLSALTKLQSVDLSANPLCLPANSDFTGLDSFTAAHLESLQLPTCTSAETMLTPAVPQNLAATVGAGQVTLSWSASANAASYELRAWDSVSRRWDTIGSGLNARTYTRSVATDERLYYFQVRARNASGVHSAWSESLYVAVVPQRFPSPPQSLEVNPFYQKYVNVGGVHMVADNNVSDEHMVQSRQIITGMLANRSDLLETLSAHGTTIFLDSRLTGRRRGSAHRGPGSWAMYATNDDPYCLVFVHEFAHQIHFALEAQPRGQEFKSRLDALYQAAMNAGRWDEMYASTNSYEYWAESVRFWFAGSLSDPVGTADCQFAGGTCTPLEQTFSKLADYEPDLVKLIEEVFGEDATVPPACKP